MVARALVVWLHGLGDSGMGWSFLKQERRLPQTVNYHFPDAPEAPVTCNDGYLMTSWMDLETIPIGRSLPDDVAGLEASTKIIHKILDDEVEKGTPSERIVVGGFSQGAAMAMLAGYSYDKPLAGVAMLSGWVAKRDSLADRMRGGANANTPLFVGHGTEDNVVLPECGQDAVDESKKAGVDVTSLTYPVAHGAHPAGMQALRAWLVQSLKIDEDA